MAMDISNIILGYKQPDIMSPQEQQAKKLNLQNLLQTNRMNEATLQDRELARAENSRLQDLLRSGKSTAKDLIGSGFLKEGREQGKYETELANNELEQKTKQFNLAKERNKVYGQTAMGIMQNPTRQNAEASLMGLAERGLASPEDVQKMIANIPQNDAEIPQWASQYVRESLDVEKQLAKYETRDTGQQLVTQGIDPLTGKVSQVSALQKMQTPDSIASNERMAREGALNRGVTMRGQDLTNSRAREKNAIDASAGGYSTKPLPATALKMQNEGLDKLSIASNNNERLGKVLEQLDTGKLQLGLASNLVGKARNYAGMSTESSRNLSSFKSTLEKLRNDSLRLNTGVQTDGDAQRAWNELFENINDQDLVKQRLKEIQEINTRGAELQKLQVENIRSNYNASPVDFGKYEVGNKQAPRGATPQGKPKTADDFLKSKGY